MPKTNYTKTIERGLKVAEAKIYHEDKIWSRYSNDKVDIGEELAKVTRTLAKALPLHKDMRALSIGSSAEPQFRILETAYRGGLYLLDKDKEALDVVKERVTRQYTGHVNLVKSDFTRNFLKVKETRRFLSGRLKREKVNLITLHHSLYYCDERNWLKLFENLYRHILSKMGAIHAVLMAAESASTYTTTWLYNHFVCEFFGCDNDQDLVRFSNILKKNGLFKNLQILAKTHKVKFFVDDFAKFMAVVWMILLYPDVHQYSLAQREKITEYIYKKFWSKKKPLIQEQEHLVVYRGIGFRGLI